ncbi:hypothetical protein E0H85_10085 [Acinetobacter terrae]|uniref:Uncharacterized protein n=1 Tax=Acinetobacter terrae TaxID=2731247 RepID=A0A4R0EM14_9GAMM|nr:hypothetical protein E0H85_10085 [Acinetobacter terrae]
MEIVSDKCLVQISHNRRFSYYADECFYVSKNTQFKIIAENIIDYIYHLEDR